MVVRPSASCIRGIRLEREVYTNRGNVLGGPLRSQRYGRGENAIGIEASLQLFGPVKLVVKDFDYQHKFTSK